MRKKSMGNRTGKSFGLMIALIVILVIGIIICVMLFFQKERKWETPETLLITYMDHISKKEYEEMYKMVNEEESRNISQEDFVKRNQAIYEAMEVENIKIKVNQYSKKEKTVNYTTSFDTIAGEVTFENEVTFLKGEKGYELNWSDALIFPQLGESDKVRVETTQAQRGSILDRNGTVLAGPGVASLVGIVPGKLDSKDEAIQRLATILELQPEVIEKQLADSGYGQGQMLINPLHMSSIYTAFCNGGNILQPYLLYQEEAKAQTWIPEAFSPDVASQVLEGMKRVINDPNGTGYGAHRDDIVFAGKTGTAEIKVSKEDTTGTELGWLTIFTADKAAQNPILITTMVEDVKERGGSGYVLENLKNVLD